MFLFMILFSWYGNTVNVVFMLSIEIFGCFCYVITGYMRKSMNLMILNIIAIVVSTFGIIKYFLV